ncbi:hypothetical protein [Brevibacillus reuszeri]|nr:hypothetical protein [Brevibacillus reuszeri]
MKSLLKMMIGLIFAFWSFTLMSVIGFIGSGAIIFFSIMMQRNARDLP